MFVPILWNRCSKGSCGIDTDGTAIISTLYKHIFHRTPSSLIHSTRINGRDGCLSQGAHTSVGRQASRGYNSTPLFSVQRGQNPGVRSRVTPETKILDSDLTFPCPSRARRPLTLTWILCPPPPQAAPSEGQGAGGKAGRRRHPGRSHLPRTLQTARETAWKARARRGAHWLPQSGAHLGACGPAEPLRPKLLSGRTSGGRGAPAPQSTDGKPLGDLHPQGAETKSWRPAAASGSTPPPTLRHARRTAARPEAVVVGGRLPPYLPLAPGPVTYPVEPISFDWA